MPYCSGYCCSNSSVRNFDLSFSFPLKQPVVLKQWIHNCGYFCSYILHLEKTLKMITYDDQTSQGVSTTPVLCVFTCHVIKK